MTGLHKLCMFFGAAFALVLSAYATPASAQATRTWVSGVGDDANPCSRTAPCKTFAGAISKTAAGGEINCLDPGGFGAVTITKSMTINCLYTEGGVLAGGNGITINAAATDVIFLRGLDIFGVAPPTHGVRIINAGAVYIEDSTIRRFNSVNSFGVSFQPSGSTRLYISNTTIADNGNGATGGGILIQPTGAGGNGRVTLNNVRVENNAGEGIRMTTAGNTSSTVTRVTVHDSMIAGSPTGLSLTRNPGDSAIELMLVDSTVFNNTTGISATGSGAVAYVGNTTLTGNNVAVAIASSAAIHTYGDNRTQGNAVGSSFTQPPLAKQ